MGLRSLLYGLYERQLTAQLRGADLPRHIGVILDGNRRWAKTIGAPAAHGHQKGADKITEVLEWSQEAGVEVVTLWLLSTDNLDRDPHELEPLLEIICGAVENLADDGRWRLRHVGDATLLPADAAARIAAAVGRTEDAPGVHVNVAVGYGGRHEITDAVRSYLRECDAQGLTLADAADRLAVDHIEDHLYTKGQPDPDLVIRTSGEQRLSGFLMWQSAHTEFYFCEAYWPAFRRVDFLRALRDYALRERRLGR
ncbi:isoprenyl transferase [Demequina capsici]|uniref:Isoprenyl transferase n=1 Tax=Demequina capsici TaxID=3075620 RepID=A0AA96JAU0_9MICO|nr:MULTISPECIES: isoprenyl transferase [unclassified Demequina]WNM25066.1 isoprenyl transferase [Demequina sp. OYTSA14]WNM27972.1 isoprenyl transferase [Demequina sp. PMTSA13]